MTEEPSCPDINDDEIRIISLPKQPEAVRENRSCTSVPSSPSDTSKGTSEGEEARAYTSSAPRRTDRLLYPPKRQEVVRSCRTPVPKSPSGASQGAPVEEKACTHTSSAPCRTGRWLVPGVLLLVAFLLLAGGCLWFAVFRSPATDSTFVVDRPADGPRPVSGRAYAERTDTTVNGVGLIIFTPCRATPVLQVGSFDSAAVLVVPAADVRRDNGGMVGAFVLSGRLLSRGQAKSGFCAIIDGRMTIGVADATPLLERALDTDGYFFRQYPLVVGGQVVENKLRGRSQRKALIERDGEISVVLTEKALSMNDFSQLLVDIGVSNAIYLVGSTAYGFARDADGRKTEFGTPCASEPENVNYIVWR